jgi:hypothetical protein
MIVCNQDGTGCTGGEDGEPCPECLAYQAESMADARRSWEVATLEERDPRRYEEEMRDAGRLGGER